MITIHVGLHKTGSTSIQAALGLISHRRGLLVEALGPASQWSDEIFTRRLVNESRSRHVIVSDENILGAMEEVYHSAPDRLADIRSALAGSDYQIVMYIRPQTTWLPSAYLQYIQQGGTLSGSDFLDEILKRPLLFWSALYDIVVRESGARRVLVRAHIPSRDVVSDFFVTCGLGRPPSPAPEGIRINASISAAQAPILRSLNSDPEVSAEERLRLRRLFQGHMALPCSRWSPFSRQDQQKIADLFRSDWLTMAEVIDDIESSDGSILRDSVDFWDRHPLPFAGANLSDPVIVEEMLRCVRALSYAAEAPAPGILMRAVDKVRKKPRDFPRALHRAVRGRR